MADKKNYIGPKETEAINACLQADLEVQIKKSAFGVKIIGMKAKTVYSASDTKK